MLSSPVACSDSQACCKLERESSGAGKIFATVGRDFCEDSGLALVHECVVVARVDVSNRSRCGHGTHSPIVLETHQT